ncbi:D-alanyl-D-alanine carboxypeptidase/D-alanyl-D-alanine-endopeptidase [Actinobacteria bacterium YIM 96077]|uniref:D-alanyl-D-alanine carboxypeptidase/D-alanyl-D-alanine-endopeptidase n=1 Tax=Phytoactinopolyspora halophila TaxID=1981511 RepID=A0A329QGW6_9ACTN|nr:D-alanyl-D-alanine carboxypeptidase/D-alanyl-D-alanine-endopeptidase [Phytoactinopolyspora halophila]AYY14062.1 D-alanyl-D-alanine carboxypeptidase/D-alanyl-D-alanine-endopeptidase [Actinobacteria bacterium YIM 96077]RAW10969.1 D-alanyl-D-alanine carboxypeptidase/D-alanyl-D-alanine-endopeptidase [Phytoactinopolyspora halophila]
MRGSIRGVVATLAAGGLVAAFNVVPSAFPSADEQFDEPAASDLAADIDEILDDPRMDGSQASVVVADAETGDVLYDRDGENRLMPASNQKMVTSAAAMELLGPDYTFTTTVESDAQQRGRVLAGDLYLRGTGDPTMLAEDYEALADEIADAGIQRVHGAVVADDTWFDDVRLGLGWDWDDEQYYYSAQISALSIAPDTDYDAGTVIIKVDPGSTVGDEPEVTVIPDNDYVEIINEAETTEAGTGRSIGINRDRGSNTIRITGTIATDGGQARVWRSVWEPTGLAAHVFHDALEERGVAVRGDVEVGETPDGAEVLASHESMTLSELLIPFMKLSNNGHAEVLMKAMGRERSDAGTWAAGREAVSEALQGWDVDPSDMAIADGSGLARRNWVPPNQLIALLRGIQDEPWFDAWYESMPLAGAEERFEGGTLRFRMDGTAAEGNVRAKTGTLTGATALSGYVTTADDQELVFSIIFNNYLSGKPSDLEDRIAVRLAEHGGEGETSTGTFSVPAPPVEQPGDVECSWVKAC